MHQPTVHLFCLILALVLAGLATVGIPGKPNFQLFPAAFFFYVLGTVFV